MNPLSSYDRKRKLPVLLAAVVLLQTLLGIPEISAMATADSAADPHHISTLADVDPAPESLCDTENAGDCSSPSDPDQCDHCCCCHGTHSSLLADLIILHDQPNSRWLMPPWDRSPSGSNAKIYRPPIA